MRIFSDLRNDDAFLSTFAVIITQMIRLFLLGGLLFLGAWLTNCSFYNQPDRITLTEQPGEIDASLNQEETNHTFHSSNSLPKKGDFVQFVAEIEEEDDKLTSYKEWIHSADLLVSQLTPFLFVDLFERHPLFFLYSQHTRKSLSALYLILEVFRL